MNSVMYYSLKTLSYVVHLQVEIQSGRPHQIRIHLSSIGHPLLGNAVKSNSFIHQLLNLFKFSTSLWVCWKFFAKVFFLFLFLFFLVGDPLYVAGGQPNCLHSEVVNQSFAEDGYEFGVLFNFILYILVSIKHFFFS